MDKVFKIEDLRPIRDEMTISRNSRLSAKTPITYFSLGKGTSISQESYDKTTVYIGSKGCADFLIGADAAKHTVSEGDMLVVPSLTLCGVTNRLHLHRNHHKKGEQQYEQNYQIRRGHEA